MEQIAQLFTNKKRLLVLMLASTLLLYFIFSPAINILYYAGDDFRYAFGGFNKSCPYDDGFQFVLTLGRPIQGYLDCLSFKFAYTLERMSIIRIISVIFMGCAMGLFADVLFSIGFSYWTAFFCAGIIFLIQQIYPISILIGAYPLPFTLFIILVSYKCLGQYHRYASLHNPLNKRKQLTWFWVSAILIICALLTYPAMAFFWGILVLAKLLFSNLSAWPKTRVEVIKEASLFFTACILYFLYAYYNMHFNAQAPVPPAYHLDHPNFNILEIIKRIMTIINVFNPIWSMLPSNQLILQGWIIIGILISGLACGIFNFFNSSLYLHNKKTTLTWLLQATSSGFIILSLCNAFLLVIPQLSFVIAERWLLFVTFSSGIILIFWCVYQFFCIFPTYFKRTALYITVCIPFLIEAYQANVVMLARASTAAQYMNVHGKILSEYLATGNNLKRVHFIIPESIYPYDKFFLTNAVLVQLLGHGKYDLKWCSLARGIPGKEMDHQKEMMTCLKNLPPNGIGVTYSYLEEPYKKTNDMLVIDSHHVNIEKYFNEILKNNFNISGWSRT